MDNTVEIFKALSDGTRIKIIMLLSRQEMAVCELIEALKLSQPAVSHHLKILKQAGIVKDSREGKWMFYSIDNKNFEANIRLLEQLFVTVQENVKKGVLPSPIRTEPCLCEVLKSRAGK